MNPKIINRLRYTAVLDSRTTPICRSLDGRIYQVGQGPRPPQHWNCRSIMIPVLNKGAIARAAGYAAIADQLQGYTGEARRRRVLALLGDPQAEPTYAEWFARQSVANGKPPSRWSPGHGKLPKRWWQVATRATRGIDDSSSNDTDC